MGQTNSTQKARRRVTFFGRPIRRRGKTPASAVDCAWSRTGTRLALRCGRRRAPALRGAPPPSERTMDLHFVSTLTPDDEDRYAPMVLAAVRALLEPMPIAYALRIVTANGLAVQHTKAAATPGSEAASEVTTSRRAGPRLVASAS
jgi:hypothetical protein